VVDPCAEGLFNRQADIEQVVNIHHDQQLQEDLRILEADAD